jgi:hypothetical protein
MITQKIEQEIKYFLQEFLKRQGRGKTEAEIEDEIWVVFQTFMKMLRAEAVRMEAIEERGSNE